MNQSEEKHIKELKEALGEAWEINAELMAGLEVGAGKNKQLRELNAELLKVLKYVHQYGALSFRSTQMMEEAIAKAEKLK